MEESLIKFETAKLAKEKGFDVFRHMTNNGVYDKKGVVGYVHVYDSRYHILAPTQSLLQKWLRERHKIDIFIGHGYINNMQYDTKYKTYEQALEAGLIEALKLI